MTDNTSGESETLTHRQSQWVVYTMSESGRPGRFLEVAESKDEAEQLGNKWWKAFHEGKKAEPREYAGISWAPVSDYENWSAPEDV
jgi:hypothetical protein